MGEKSHVPLCHAAARACFYSHFGRVTYAYGLLWLCTIYYHLLFIFRSPFSAVFFVCQILQPSVQQLNHCSLQWQVASTRCPCHRRNTVKSCREGLKSTAAFNLVPYGVISWHTACHTVSINIQKLAHDVDDLITFDQHPQFCILHTCGVRFPCDSIGRP